MEIFPYHTDQGYAEKIAANTNSIDHFIDSAVIWWEKTNHGELSFYQPPTPWIELSSPASRRIVAHSPEAGVVAKGYEKPESAESVFDAYKKMNQSLRDPDQELLNANNLSIVFPFCLYRNVLLFPFIEARYQEGVIPEVRTRLTLRAQQNDIRFRIARLVTLRTENGGGHLLDIFDDGHL